MLLAATVAALTWANSRWAPSYVRLTHIPFAVRFGGILELSLREWINDLLMAVFFFVIGLEIKRELVLGQLSTRRTAALPVIAALGGVIVPAAIFTALNVTGEGARGWGVPMATDIAFSLGVLALFGPRAPAGLKVFLAALAIVDDLIAVIVIGVFYTESVRIGALGLTVLLLALVALLVRAGGAMSKFCAVLAGLAAWGTVLASRLHPTVAGVLVAMVIPVRSGGPTKAMGLLLEESLHPLVAFVILPLFALANAGVIMEGGVKMLLHPVGLGVLVGLVIGKQIGIVLASWFAVKRRVAALSDGVNWPQIYGGACLAGIGFTMSLFITDLAFGEHALAGEAKVGILVASLIAALWGGAVLHACLPNTER